VHIDSSFFFVKPFEQLGRMLCYMVAFTAICLANRLFGFI